MESTGKQVLALSRHSGGPWADLHRVSSLTSVSHSDSAKEGTWYFLWMDKCWSSLGWLDQRGTGLGGQGASWGLCSAAPDESSLSRDPGLGRAWCKWIPGRAWAGLGSRAGPWRHGHLGWAWLALDLGAWGFGHLGWASLWPDIFAPSPALARPQCDQQPAQVLLSKTTGAPFH